MQKAVVQRQFVLENRGVNFHKGIHFVIIVTFSLFLSYISGSDLRITSKAHLRRCGAKITISRHNGNNKIPIQRVKNQRLWE